MSRSTQAKESGYRMITSWPPPRLPVAGENSSRAINFAKPGVCAGLLS